MKKFPLESYPIKDSTNTQRIGDVVVDSRYFDRQVLDRLLSEAELAANQQEGDNPKSKK